MNIEQLYDEYVDIVYRFFYIKSFDRALAEDLTSQTYTAVAQRLHDGAQIADGKKFLYGTMRNVWLMYLRDKYRRNEAYIEDIDDVSAYVEQTVTAYGGMTLRERAMRFISKLPEKQARIVEMRLINELSIADIAAAIGKDRNYVKTTYKRGLRALQAIVKQHQEGEEVLS